MAGHWIESETILGMTATELREALEPEVNAFLAGTSDRRELQTGLITLRERTVRVITGRHRFFAELGRSKGLPGVSPAQLAQMHVHAERIDGTLKALKDIVKDFEGRVRERIQEEILLNYPENTRAEAREIMLAQSAWIKSSGDTELSDTLHRIGGEIIVNSQHLAQLEAAGDVDTATPLRVKVSDLRAEEARLRLESDKKRAEHNSTNDEFEARLKALKSS